MECVGSFGLNTQLSAVWISLRSVFCNHLVFLRLCSLSSSTERESFSDWSWEQSWGGVATSTVLQPQSDFRSSWTEKVAVFHFVAWLSLIHYWGQSAWFSWHCWGKIQHFSNKIKLCFKESAAKSVWPFFCETLWLSVRPEEMEIRAEQNFFCWFALKVVEKLFCDYLKQIHRLS